MQLLGLVAAAIVSALAIGFVGAAFYHARSRILALVVAAAAIAVTAYVAGLHP